MESYGDESPLHLATRRGDIGTVISILRDVNCDVDSFNAAVPHMSALHIACQNGFIIIADMLLDRGANINGCWAYPCGNGNTALHIASMEGMVNIVKLLLSRGADIHLSGHGKTALHLSCTFGHAATTAVLLDSGADIHAKSASENYTALHYAAEEGNEEIVKMLLDRSAMVGFVNEDGRSALHCAWDFGHHDVAELLLRTAAGTFASHAVEDPVPRRAFGRDMEEAVKLLLNCRTDVNAATYDGLTAIHWACLGKSPGVTECLLRRGAPVNVVFRNDKDERCFEHFKGFTPLHFAVDFPNWREEAQTQIDLLELLFEWGADVNARDENNMTPLDFFSSWIDADDDHPRSIAEVFAKHFAKMRAHDLFVDESNLETLSDLGLSEDFSKACEDEIENMRRITIGDSSVSFFDFFTKGTLRLADYLANDYVSKVLKSGEFELEFPIYAGHIHKKFRLGRERLDLLRKSDSVLSLSRFRYVPYVCMRKLKRYLTNEDLQNIIQSRPIKP